ncbi:MAG: glycosyltransferase family 2 protein [Rhizomicrobium sp.]
MKFSIVTLSFNQAKFLEQAIRSVLDQDYDNIEFIVVDPGSTDGSRDVIERYRDRIAKTIFEPDHGPADGLNKGFAVATGDIYGFLNSDDVLFPGALSRVVGYFRAKPETDIVIGHEWIIDGDGCKVRKSYSDRFEPRAFAYGGGVIAQQSTFFRAELYKKTKGFDISLPVQWDTDLFLDLFQATNKTLYVDDFFGGFRIHSEAITRNRTRELEDARRACELARFERIVGRRWRRSDYPFRLYYKMRKYLIEPRALMEWLRYGSNE